MSELALKLIKEAKEKRLTRLDLGNCLISSFGFLMIKKI